MATLEPNQVIRRLSVMEDTSLGSPLSESTPQHVAALLELFRLNRGLTVTICEALPSGKSGAFVARVDCSGDADGSFVLKVAARHDEWESEVQLHARALSLGAFSNQLPSIVATEESKSHFAVIFKLAGHSRLTTRPLVGALGLFEAGYREFGKIAWTPSLFSNWTVAFAPSALQEALSYRINPEQGRIHANAVQRFGKSNLAKSSFIYDGEVLPNPVFFAEMKDAQDYLKFSILLGPIHGDCHAENIFVTPRLDGAVENAFLIDLEMFREKALFFFDHSYLELSVLLRQFDKLGSTRWLALAHAIASGARHAGLEPAENGWLAAILSARKDILERASSTYSDRADDIILQFFVANVAAGLAFLNKLPRETGGSAGMTDDQYEKALIWSAVNLKEMLAKLGVSNASLWSMEGEPIPNLRSASLISPREVQPDWEAVEYFNDKGANILILPDSGRNLFKDELILADWTVVVDFESSPLEEGFLQTLVRPYRQAWPGGESPDLRQLVRGGLWYFGNGRKDLSGVGPAVSTQDWRRRYRRSLEDLLSSLAEELAPRQVRTLILSDGLSPDYLRMLAEALQDAFGDVLAPLVLASESGGSDDQVGLATINVATRDLRAMLGSNRAPIQDNPEDPAIACRRDSRVVLEGIPESLLRRVSRDFTVLYRQRAQTMPTSRTFGVDFHRGMEIEWAELASNFDVPRERFPEYHRRIQEALSSSSTRSVELLHEPSAGGTTLARRLAWEFVDSNPVVLLDQLSTDTASYLRDLVRFSALPALVVMEGSEITKSERETLVDQLKEDNTRAVFLWVSRHYGASADVDILPSALQLGEGNEAALFRDTYLPYVRGSRRQDGLVKLARSNNSKERSPFFFGLTAFRHDYLGVERLVDDVLKGASSAAARGLLADLCLASIYSQRGFPLVEFDELCTELNAGNWPVSKESLFVVMRDSHIRVSHVVLAEEMLARLSRKADDWLADLPLLSDGLLRRLKIVHSSQSNRVIDLIDEMFFTRDSESTMREDSDAFNTSSRKYAPIIHDIGNIENARRIYREIDQLWPRQPHYMAHRARHLLYEQPREMENALELFRRAEKIADDGDPALSHMVGMAFLIRMDARLSEARVAGLALSEVESDVQADFDEAKLAFERSMVSGRNLVFGHVAIVQLTTNLLRLAMGLAQAKDLAQFVKPTDRRWYLDALAEAEGSIEILRMMPNAGHYAGRAVAAWNIVYGNHDKLINSLRELARRREDPSLRRALCAAIVSKAGHKMHTIPQADLKTIVTMSERNIVEQGVRDADVRRWLSAYRHLGTFDVQIGIERLVDWHELRPQAVEPAYYLFVFYFLRWLTAPTPREGFAAECIRWINVCRANRPLGQRSWSFEWLEKRGSEFGIVSSRSLDFDPPRTIREPGHRDHKKLVARLARVQGALRDYRGPQRATLDLGSHLQATIVPLDRLTRDDEGARVSAYISFSYDGLVGWDATVDRK